MLPLCYSQAKLLVTRLLYLSRPQVDSRVGRTVPTGTTIWHRARTIAMGVALLERRRILKKSGILPNLPIAERGLRGRYELHNISHYEEDTLYGSLRCCSRPGSG